ncbi:MAG TPA: serpin family protein [Streptosporangiaceae bacterium]|nr:serpin family protein [Streptosporangiaceae bacterium]
MTSDTQTLLECLARYARRLHAVAGAQHHVVSPLGAWLLLALVGPASSGADREALADVLGCDVDTAARIAAALLEHPHPLVASAAGVWTRPGIQLGPVFDDWRASLPGRVESGDLRDQAQLDAWAREHTFGLIDRFPVNVDDPSVYLVLATALATRVSWETPFDLAPAAELGSSSPWARELGQVLKTPRGRGHTGFIAVTPEAGDVAVHLAAARDGLVVASVAAAEGVVYGDVLAAAQRIACAWAEGSQGRFGRGEIAGVRRRRLADLPLGEAPLWRIREETSMGGGDQFTAVLPAWSARSQVGLGDPELGFGTAAHALAGAGPWQAAQSAMARYTRVGFEAAAVTGLAVFSSARPSQRVLAADLRFPHPYAVVAVATDPQRAARGHGQARPAEPASPWSGIPVFSAWVAKPEEATADEPDPAR